VVVVTDTLNLEPDPASADAPASKPLKTTHRLFEASLAVPPTSVNRHLRFYENVNFRRRALRTSCELCSGEDLAITPPVNAN